jgi:AcrR family transcriptional regulator
MEQDPGKREAILLAAMRVFARQGYVGTSIKDIAKEAGIKSTSLLYWYFKNKQELLTAVILERAPLLVQLQTRPDELMNLPPRETLTQIAQGFTQIFDQPEAVMIARLMMTELEQIGELGETVSHMQSMMMAFLVSYFQAQIDQGVLRSADPQVMARAYMGSLIAYLMTRHIFPWLSAGLPSREDYGVQVVDLLLEGMLA